ESRVPGRLVQRRDAARGAHDERFRETSAPAGLGERAEIACTDGTEVRVGCRRRGTLVLAELRRHLVRRDHVYSGQPAPELLRNRLLGGGIAAREEQADG